MSIKQPDAYTDPTWPRDAFGRPIPRTLNAAEDRLDTLRWPAAHWDESRHEMVPDTPEPAPAPAAGGDFRDTEIARLVAENKRLREQLGR
jgi:hypothetical protein